MDHASFTNRTHINYDEKGQVYVVQVSIKLSKEESDLDNDIALEETAGASTKFIMPWMKKNLIKGVWSKESVVQKINIFTEE